MTITFQSAAHNPLELVAVVAEQFSSLTIQRIVGVGLIEEIYEAVDDGVDVQYRLPILLQNVQANVAFQINVWMIDFSLAQDFGRLVGILRMDMEVEDIPSSCPVACVRTDCHCEVCKIVWIRKVNFCGISRVKFSDI